MRINNNMLAMNTHRQMGITGVNQGKSMEKLSSGQRINRAGDDAAGLAISEKMRGQIRGLNMASKNSQDGISMIQTAEGALNETHEILQRMRELSVQSANDTNVAVDREEIQKEMNQLTSEINRIGNTTEFNTQKILKGSETSVETNPAMKLDGLGEDAFSIDPTNTVAGATIDATGGSVGFTAKAGSAGINGKEMKFSFGGKEFTLKIDASEANKASIPAGTKPTISDDKTEVTAVIGQDSTDAEVATAIKAALDAYIKDNDSIDGKVTIASGNEITIESMDTGKDKFLEISGDMTDITTETANNPIFGKGTDVSYTAAQIEVDFAELDQAGIDALPGQGLTINGKTIEFYNADDGAYKGDADFGVNISSVVTAGAGSEKELVDAIVKQLSDKVEGLELSTHATTDGKLVVTSTADGAKGDGITVTDGVDVKAKTSADTFTSKFQVGANSGQSMDIKIKDMRSMAIGVSANEAEATRTAKNGVEASYVKNTNVTNGTDSDASEYSLDVSSHDKAQAAISVLNDAIESVSAQRSDLGSFQNRLEHTIKNLDASAENLQAAEARVRDVDMAKEMMELTKQNILQQASQAMMAQANQAPQGVLQLLR